MCPAAKPWPWLSFMPSSVASVTPIRPKHIKMSGKVVLTINKIKVKLDNRSAVVSRTARHFVAKSTPPPWLRSETSQVFYRKNSPLVNPRRNPLSPYGSYAGHTCRCKYFLLFRNALIRRLNPYSPKYLE